MPSTRVLVVDDEVGMLEVCADILKKLDGADVFVESDSKKALRRATTETFDLMICDLRMPDVDGVELIRAAREHDPTLTALVLTAFPTVETAVETMKLGAVDYITKPFIPEDLLATVRRVLREKRLSDENRLLSRHLEGTYRPEELIGDSPAMRTLVDAVARVARTDADVLVLGETGTGKELVARAIHRGSARRERRFVPVDCGAIPDSLMESEFFGHERGAFTGAAERSLGLMEFADGGTFFLDEIGELPIRLQAKLLRALQERRIRRVGGTRETDVDVRIVAATARDLEREIEKNSFRQDLYYRINVARIVIPPLRERHEDVIPLARHFTKLYASQMGRGDVELDEEALEVLAAYRWPGNVRELQNVVKRSIAMTEAETITPEQLPEDVVMDAHETPAAGGFFEQRERHVAAFEARRLSEFLSSNGGDVAAAARAAELPRGTFYRLLKKHGIDPADYRA